MNWKMLFNLSLFGLAMAIGTVYIIPSSVEPFVWLAIFLYCGYFIAKHSSGKVFLHGFVLSLFNCVWITAAHYLLYDSYMLHHPAEAAMVTKSPISPKLMMLVTGPVIGITSGLILGAFSLIASKILVKFAK